MKFRIGIDVGGTTTTIPVGDNSREVLTVSEQFESRTAEGPDATISAIIDQIEQGLLGGPIDTGRDRAAHPQCDFPRSTANSTACSTIVDCNRSTSARNAAASAASWRD